MNQAYDDTERERERNCAINISRRKEFFSPFTRGSININSRGKYPLVCRSSTASREEQQHRSLLPEFRYIHSTPFAGVDGCSMSSTSKARITIFQLPTSPEFAKRVNLYADPEPCIKTFRRADFLSFIMIHQKLLFASHPRRKTSTKLPTSFSKQERIPHPREIIFERRANSPLLSSPPDIGLDTSHFESGHQCQDENSNNVSRRGGGSSTPRSARIGTSSGNKTRWCLSREKGSRR